MEQLVNTIQSATSSDVTEYETVPEGRRRMGLVEVKNCKIRDFHNKEQMNDALRFVFRDKVITNGFVTATVAAKTGNKKASLVRLMRNMTDGVVGERTTPDEMFEAIRTCVGLWFDVRVVHNHSQTPDGSARTYCNVSDLMVLPAEGEPIDAMAFFDSMRKDEAPQATNGTSAPKPLKEYYNIVSLSADSRAKAEKLIKDNGGQFIREPGYWGSPVSIRALARLVCSEQDATDDINF